MPTDTVFIFSFHWWHWWSRISKTKTALSHSWPSTICLSSPTPSVIGAEWRQPSFSLLQCYILQSSFFPLYNQEVCPYLSFMCVTCLPHIGVESICNSDLLCTKIASVEYLCRSSEVLELYNDCDSLIYETLTVSLCHRWAPTNHMLDLIQVYTKSTNSICNIQVL